MHMLPFHLAQVFYTLYVFTPFFFKKKTKLMTVQSSEAALLFHILVLDRCSVQPVRADCEFCMMVEWRLLS